MFSRNDTIHSDNFKEMIKGGFSCQEEHSMAFVISFLHYFSLFCYTYLETQTTSLSMFEESARGKMSLFSFISDRTTLKKQVGNRPSSVEKG